jgi:hypothetical protein
MANLCRPGASTEQCDLRRAVRVTTLTQPGQCLSDPKELHEVALHAHSEASTLVYCRQLSEVGGEIVSGYERRPARRAA